MNDIPRYKASFPIQKTFITNSDACGDHVYTQVARKGNVAVYRRNKLNGSVFGFETIVIKTVKAGTVYAKGATPTAADTESYPGAQSFGKLGWHYPTQEAALNKLEELVKEEVKPEMVGNYVLPSVEFTFVEFATVNKLPIDKGTATIIQNLLRDKSLKMIRVEVRNGKSAQIFGKA